MAAAEAMADGGGRRSLINLVGEEWWGGCLVIRR